MDFRSEKPSDNFMLWVDAVGGFWVCMADEVLLGQPVRSGSVDVPILGDIPIIGTFFRSQSNRKIRNELLVFVTPRIIKD